MSDEELRRQALGLGIEYVDLDVVPLPRDLVQVLPESIASRYNVVCAAVDEDWITVATARPTDPFPLDDIEFRCGLRARYVAAPARQIRAIIESAYSVQVPPRVILPWHDRPAE